MRIANVISRPIIALAIALVAFIALSGAVLADLEFTENAQNEFENDAEFGRPTSCGDTSSYGVCLRR